ncbi:unnamed protein product, partial [Mesorhabditis belari]|uniref:Ig-like domain-containing protein n=1 Tax=Mesorhabditis belari TaxID=2138241 RepID=A0AAF3EQ21_9BILA
MLLYVFFLPIICAIEVQINPQKSSIELEVGAQLSLLCKVTGLSPEVKPGITWSRHKGLPNRDNVKVSRLDNATLSLVIDRTIARDSGVYTCNAIIDGESANKSVDVHVFGTNGGNSLFAEHGHLKTVKIGHLTEGKSLDLSCETIPGVTPHKTVWSRHELFFDRLEQAQSQTNWVLLKGGSVLRIKNYNAKIDNGRYDCGVTPKDQSTETTWRSFYIGPTENEKSSFSICRQICQDTCNNVISGILDKNI